ncbi:hypothetical protein C8J45_10353 [Sphingomonas sp. PP-CE-3G-477]|uniref:hypothetical protein n=1 Tax=unclassified Sphingomonas TaxID=196159 RepID=UPI000D3845C1|nr:MULTISPECIES: hypothetical protein [unclassified Sphingomonas]MBE2991261.1 hypothetical protein [Sphingomonas sp. CFBP 13603]PTQ64208.1 hypothetical protein C8J45_10353 [Sphingomonas sp. PP-CE-3G-477]
MSDDTRPDQDQMPDTDVPTRRRVLALGAVGAGAVVSIRPALAQTVGSVLTCEIAVPDRSRAGGYIDRDGKVVPARTKGAFPPSNRAFKGEEVRRAMANGSTLPGTDSDRSRAYVKYIRRLQRGQGGFTCFASLQMPRG